MICPNCGNLLADGTRFCNHCGTAAPAADPVPAAEPVPEAAPVPEQTSEPAAAVQPPIYQQPTGYQQPAGYQKAPVYQQPVPPYQQAPAYQPYVAPAPTEPLTMGQFLGMELLMLIPIANIVLLFIWGFGAGTNVNKANWAKSKLIVVAISLVLAILLASVLVGIFAELARYGAYGYYYW